MVKIYSEFGFGNNSFLSSEIEKDSKEHRIKKFICPPKLEGIYLRIWIFHYTFALSTNRFFNYQKKSKRKFKLLFGIEGKR